MSNGKPNILGKLPVYNDAKEIFDAGADKVHFEHKQQRKAAFSASDKTASFEAKDRPTKKTPKKDAVKGKSPKLSGKQRPKYSSGKKVPSKKGYGSGAAMPNPGKGKKGK